MRAARAATTESGRFYLRTEASESAVRALLAELRARLLAAGLTESDCGTVELVLAEALNNIVEHAYAGKRAEIGVEAVLAGGMLRCTLTDRGAALPRLRLPEGQPPGVDMPTEQLPEGGFGWFLIRSLTRSLSYARAGGVNRLTLRFKLANGPDPAT